MLCPESGPGWLWDDEQVALWALSLLVIADQTDLPQHGVQGINAKELFLWQKTSEAAAQNVTMLITNKYWKTGSNHFISKVHTHK